MVIGQDGLVGLAIEPANGGRAVKVLWKLEDARMVAESLLEAVNDVERRSLPVA